MGRAMVDGEKAVDVSEFGEDGAWDLAGERVVGGVEIDEGE